MPVTKTTIVLLYSTFPTRRSAVKVADVLLSHRTIACANLLPSTMSMYIWNGKKTKSREVILLCKTTRRVSKKAERILAALHPYECPCILRLPVTAHAAYTEWVHEAVSN